MSDGAPQRLNVVLDPVAARKEQALKLLSDGMPIGQVAETIGVSRQSVWYWRTRDPGFVVAVNRAVMEERRLLETSILSLAPEILAEAQRLLADKNTPPATRASVVVAWMSYAGAVAKRAKTLEVDLEKVKQQMAWAGLAQ